ncbi:hypothetical protein HNQ77_005297 [Silvibacterium bohemicum]|uniref:Uncharacterized protein n=1 Tax=Silvibacterium bohemicum TaxID=1577686 RepID=A0A841K858_9BACT|nr:hypothetical protein [Silvibacterium bohemicum]MBB6147301.1 hypothetical protein [Silvibacterium bohemicum]
MKDRVYQQITERGHARTAPAVGLFDDIARHPYYTSNDLLFKLHGIYLPRPLNYEIVAQSADEVQDIQNAPALSMRNYLEESGQLRLITSISIYSQLGKDRAQLRLLYMNTVAFLIWQSMEKQPRPIGAQHRPPQNAVLAFGIPFSE